MCLRGRSRLRIVVMDFSIIFGAIDSDPLNRYGIQPSLLSDHLLFPV